RPSTNAIDPRGGSLLMAKSSVSALGPSAVENRTPSRAGGKTAKAIGKRFGSHETKATMSDHIADARYRRDGFGDGGGVPLCARSDGRFPPTPRRAPVVAVTVVRRGSREPRLLRCPASKPARRRDRTREAPPRAPLWPPESFSLAP